MTASAPDDRPPSATPPTPGRPPTAPTPPRSRLGAHLLSLFAGLVLTPVGIVLLAAGAAGIADALARAQEPATTALVLAAGGGLFLGVVALVASGSALGPLVGGGVFALAPGVGFIVANEAMTDLTRAALDPIRPVTGRALGDGAVLLGSSGALAVLGLTIVLVGVAAHVARRSGRRTERAEAALARAARGPAPGPAQPLAAPTPPRSRVLAHVLAAAGGFLVTPLALALVAAGSVDLSMAVVEGTGLDVDLLFSPAAVGTILLAVVVLSAGWSSLGLGLGGVFLGIVPGVVGLLSPEATHRGVGALLENAGQLFDPDAAAGLYLFTTLGVLLAWGLVAALGAIGVHGARRDGRQRERLEILVAQGRRA